MQLANACGKQLKALELCAGSGHWTDGVVDAGFIGEMHDIAFDAMHDLRSRGYVAGVKLKSLQALHCGVCCTTFSRKANPPYRTKQFIKGIDTLKVHKKEKCNDANLMVDHACELLLWHAKSGCRCSL